MRLLTSVLCWLLATLALAVAVPAAWAQHNVVDRNGYSALATSAARDPVLQQAMAGALANQLTTLAANSGYGGANPNLIAGAARAYTGGDAFPGQFALANEVAHEWLFTETVGQADASGRWVIDLSPMLSNASFQQTLSDFTVPVPGKLEIPLTEDVSHSLRPGQLREVAAWGPWVSVGSAALAGVFALLTLAAARRRGKALVALGVSGLVVGAAGWAAIEVGRRYLAKVLDAAATDVRNVAAAMVEHAIGSAHMWLNLTLAAGGALVVLGVLVTTMGGLRRS